MNAFKEALIHAEEEEHIVDVCDHCGEAIHTGQTVWKVGGEMYCNRSCLDSGLQVITLKI